MAGFHIASNPNYGLSLRTGSQGYGWYDDSSGAYVTPDEYMRRAQQPAVEEQMRRLREQQAQNRLRESRTGLENQAADFLGSFRPFGGGSPGGAGAPGGGAVAAPRGGFGGSATDVLSRLPARIAPPQGLSGGPRPLPGLPRLPALPDSAGLGGGIPANLSFEPPAPIAPGAAALPSFGSMPAMPPLVATLRPPDMFSGGGDSERWAMGGGGGFGQSPAAPAGPRGRAGPGQLGVVGGGDWTAPAAPGWARREQARRRQAWDRQRDRNGGLL